MVEGAGGSLEVVPDTLHFTMKSTVYNLCIVEFYVHFAKGLGGPVELGVFFYS